jgi:mono/diheme cytochrome c family protein
MVAYLRTVTPVRNQPPASRYAVALPAAYGPPVGRVPDVPRTDPVRYGEYLAGPVARCVECHSPPGPGGLPDMGRLAAGGFPFPGPWGTSYSTNLTADPDTGIGRWADGEIIASLHGARRGGGAVLPPMPWPYFAAGLDPDDVKALIAYLRSLPPIRNAVPAPRPPGG